MNEIIKVRSASYGRYEELLLRRDRLKKEAYYIELKYARVFGELLIALYEEQIKCVKLKKTIEFCQAALNHGKPVDTTALREFIADATALLRQNLDDLVAQHKEATAMTRITEAEADQITKIYRRIAKQIHPDVNPMTADSPKLLDLWNQTILAYKNNDLKYLQDLEVLVVAALEKLTRGLQIEIDIPDVEERIAAVEREIVDILETNPYQYKFILYDKNAVEEKKTALREELRQYQDYGAQLEARLKLIFPYGNSDIWETI